MTLDQAPIGVFDSGVGGLTVVKALRQTLPSRDIVYLGDTARVPYGSKSPRTVERYSLACQQFLLGYSVGLVMVACNTASANALQALQTVSPVPVIGAVEPGAETALAATKHGRIGVIGTLATAAAGAYEQAIAKRDAAALVTTLACPLLVPLAEEGWVSGDIARAVARRYLTELFARDAEIDTLVLGCTHYPLLAEVLAETATDLARHTVVLVDSASSMADAARAALGPEPTGRGRLRCFATDTSRLAELGPRFLGEPLESFQLVDL